MKKQFDVDFEPPSNCVEEKVLDEISYQAHLKHYHAENKKLQDEFRHDLIEKYGMTNHPKANECFDMAWDFGSGSGLWEVEDYFVSIVDLVKGDLQDPDYNISESLYTNDIVSSL